MEFSKNLSTSKPNRNLAHPAVSKEELLVVAVLDMAERQKRLHPQYDCDPLWDGWDEIVAIAKDIHLAAVRNLTLYERRRTACGQSRDNKVEASLWQPPTQS